MSREKEVFIHTAYELGILPGKNSLKTMISRYLIIMGILMAVLPPFFAFLFEYLDVGAIFFYISMPVLVFAILLFFIFYTVKRILYPVKKLLMEVKKLQDGNLNINTDISGYEEIESLSRSIERMRNSLYIATSFLGKRDRTMDRSIEKELSRAGLYTVFLLPFLFYGISISLIAGFIYSKYASDIFGNIILLWEVVRSLLMVFYVLVMAAALAFILSRTVGNSMRKLAISAEKSSKGEMDVDFKVSKNLGYIHELSIVLENLKNALERAMKEMEGEG